MSSPPPSVTVVVTNHNYAQFLAAALDSLLSGSECPDEIVVVDDGSTDDSRRVLRQFPTVRAIFAECRGQTAAMNAGWRASRGQVIVFLDADDVLLNDGLSRLRAPFAVGTVAAVHGPTVEIDISGRSLHRLRPRAGMPSGDLVARLRTHGPASYEPPPTSGNAWSREFLDAVMPLPEIEREFGTGSAHADLFLTDLAPFFGTIVALTQPVAGYRIHGKNDFATDDERIRFARDVRCFDERCRRLAGFFASQGVIVDVESWRRSSWVQLVQATYADITETVGPEARFLLMDEQQLPALMPARAVPFTSSDGIYHGPPADDATAVAEIEARRAEGIDAIVVAGPAFWWLSYYSGLARYLEQEWRTVRSNDHVRIFRAE